MKYQVPDASELEQLVCTGYSMYPTLRVLDVLYVSPYGEKPILCGDVVVFISPVKSRVTHRVVSICPDGIITRGDYNAMNDPWRLKPVEIIGQVVRVRRGEKKIKIHGGQIGNCVGCFYHGITFVKNALIAIIKPVYHTASKSGVFRLWIPAALKPRMLRFTRFGKVELQLLMGGTNIGSYVPEKGCWLIKPPFRLFVDESALLIDTSVSVNLSGEVNHGS